MKPYGATSRFRKTTTTTPFANYYPPDVITFVGEKQSDGGTDAPLDGRIARRIAFLWGVPVIIYLACHRINLVDPTAEPGWNVSPPFERWLDVVRGRAQRIVLLGRFVHRVAFLDDAPLLSLALGGRALVFPHPSGRNRWWNDPRNTRRAQSALRKFLTEEPVRRKASKPMVRSGAAR